MSPYLSAHTRHTHNSRSSPYRATLRTFEGESRMAFPYSMRREAVYNIHDVLLRPPPPPPAAASLPYTYEPHPQYSHLSPMATSPSPWHHDRHRHINYPLTSAPYQLESHLSSAIPPPHGQLLPNTSNELDALMSHGFIPSGSLQYGPGMQSAMQPTYIPVQHTSNLSACSTYPRPLRYGYWNRRGDTISPDGRLLSAPVGLAYPTELRNYPENILMNEMGHCVLPDLREERVRLWQEGVVVEQEANLRMTAAELY